MRHAIFILVCISWFAGPETARAGMPPQNSSAPSVGDSANGGAQTIDGVAARIEDDVLTESELRELAGFQQLVDGHAKSRADLIRELADQWSVRGEADAAKFPKPAASDLDRAYAQIVGQFPSPEDFKNRCTAAGLTEAGVRRVLLQQLYLSRFLDYRFRPAAQVDQGQIEKYYHDELTPQLKAHGQPVPPLEEVEDTIREVLVQRAINDRAKQWLDETRAHLRIDAVQEGERP
jgi:hypothetical protein